MGVSMIKSLAVLLALLLSQPAIAEDSVIADLFARQGLAGTMVIASLHTGRTFVHDDLRAAQRFSIASTFKIMNTLIALEEKVVTGKDDVLKWDGQMRDFPDWNRDQTLDSAFKVSCVWCYQEFARQVGADRYQRYLRNSGYGDLRMPFDETTFWLDGSLQVSALEQVDFLRKVYLRTLPFSASSYETLRQIMQVEEAPSFAMWAKTGWAARAEPQVGWYVGYVETARDVWFFATNIEIRDETDLPLRRKLTREALQAKGIIP